MSDPMGGMLAASQAQSTSDMLRNTQSIGAGHGDSGGKAVLGKIFEEGFSIDVPISDSPILQSAPEQGVLKILLGCSGIAGLLSVFPSFMQNIGLNSSIQALEIFQSNNISNFLNVSISSLIGKGKSQGK